MFWDGESYELLTSLPSIGGYVYSIAASYLDPFKIIYGVGDNLIRVWNTRYGNEKPYDTNLIWQGIKSKVTVVCLALRFLSIYFVFVYLFLVYLFIYFLSYDAFPIERNDGV